MKDLKMLGNTLTKLRDNKTSYLILSAVSIATYFSIPHKGEASSKTNTTTLNVTHKIIHPTRLPDTASGCTFEAARYASALATLNDARRAADEAYRRWYECESQGGGDPRPGEANARQPLPPPPELSVVVDSSVR